MLISFCKRALLNFEYRTVVFAFFSFILNLLYSAYSVFSFALDGSLLRGAVGVYYALLAFLRISVILTYSRAPHSVRYRMQLYRYFYSGLILFVTTLVLSVFGIWGDVGARGASLLHLDVTVAVSYSVIRGVGAIVGALRARGHNEPSIRAMKGIGLVDLFASLTALSGEIPVGGDGIPSGIELLSRGLRGVFSSVSVILSLSLSVYMMIDAKKELNGAK